MLDRRAAVTEGFPRLEARGWRLQGCGAYFAYVAHPFPEDSETAAKRLVKQAGILLLPGTMFTPEGDEGGARSFRIAFANVDRPGIDALLDRLADASP